MTDSSPKYVYFFSAQNAEGSAQLKPLLGGKGANLAEMAQLGLPVPPGFTITTEACRAYYKEHQETLWPTLKSEILTHLTELQATTGKTFGTGPDPLLVSVRSGAALSMPGMMDTVLNLGLNDETVVALGEKTQNPRFAFDAYRRLLQMFGNVVLDIPHHDFEHELDAVKTAHNVTQDTDLTVEQLQTVIRHYKEVINRHGHTFPQDPMAQLWAATDAVFGSWNNPRAIAYRQINDMHGLHGTAVNIQTMVFGNRGQTSGTGVAFTRHPSTGEKVFFGEYLLNAQGEDVVAGIRTPQAINTQADPSATQTLESALPEVYAQLDTIQQKLETHYTDMQDIEFTIEDGQLYLLQTRTGKRTAKAMVKIAVDMVSEGLIDQRTALLRLDPHKVNELLHPTFDPSASVTVLGQGLPASPGAAVGQICFDSTEAVSLHEAGHPTILVRVETSPEDISGMHAAAGVLTARGGMTSHAAVVARGMGKCCVSGCTELSIDYAEQRCTLTTKDGTLHTLRKGDWLSLNGSTGEILADKVATIPAQLDDDLMTVLQWADDTRTLRVRTNADTPTDAQTARDFGAEGIGLCRTEHMFFDGDRITHVRAMILADTLTERQQALDLLLPYQQSDFEGIFTAMDGLPVTVRLLDPPLHEFLPQQEAEMKLVAQALGLSLDAVRDRIHALHESNPMLGLRGCRLGVLYPEITTMQVTALMQAALHCQAQGLTVKPEIMVPLVGHGHELALQRQLITDAAQAVFDSKGQTIEYLIGTMIELPRACLTADEIAHHADFFSFGTNDLTQTTLGLSRDDAGRFLPAYQSQGIIERDPFVSLDQSGVGQLVELAVQKGQATNPKLKIGVCGEHGGDPTSIEFFQRQGLRYVSCSPFRVPIARIAAAQAALR